MAQKTEKPTVNSSNQKKSSLHFESNSKYFTILIYSLIFVILATLSILIIAHWNTTVNTFRTIITILKPFVIAFFIAYIINPFVKWIDRILERFIYRSKCVRGRKITAIALAYIFVLMFITIALFYIIPELMNSVKDINTVYNEINLNNIEEDVTSTLSDLQKQFPFLKLDQLDKKVHEFLPQVFNYGASLLSNFLSWSISLVKTVINILLAIVISCYMLADKQKLHKNMKRISYAILPVKKADSMFHTLKECNSIFSNFIIGKSIDSLIIGLICFVVMNILQLKYSILLSIIVGITNMIPYFGPFIGAVPGVIIYLLMDPVKALIFAIMILALQQFDGLYLGPKILGESTGLSPLWVIFGITVGGALFGVIGMFLGVPFTAVIAYLLNRFINHRLQEKQIEL